MFFGIVNLGTDFSQKNLYYVFNEWHVCHLVITKVVVLKCLHSECMLIEKLLKHFKVMTSELKSNFFSIAWVQVRSIPFANLDSFPFDLFPGGFYCQEYGVLL